MPPKGSGSRGGRNPTNKTSAAPSTSRAAPASRGRPSRGRGSAKSAASPSREAGVNVAASEEDEVDDDGDDEEEEEEKKKTIPPDLVTKLLHEFFQNEDGTTRITKDANGAIAKYMDVFLREAIARAAVESPNKRFLEVEDLELIAPQLLLDL
ncbi:CENP-S associating centromere protein X-domain-containing protein [Bombardia bombarda]|uniref:CENP-S associating centromere protein X-domain-containing protein n=1 Tax=Bombardia bombarda TaxID=252184 RepID=A0AA39XI07_9PEZI|nr:CENP-S associating centromere protein X-domain-containing protein [Bombardia bombarda]